MFETTNQIRFQLTEGEHRQDPTAQQLKGVGRIQKIRQVFQNLT